MRRRLRPRHRAARRGAHQHRTGRGERDGRPARGAPRLVAGAADHRAVRDRARTRQGAEHDPRGRPPARHAAHGHAASSTHVEHHAAIVPRRVRRRPRHLERPAAPGAVEIPIDLQYATGEVRASASRSRRSSRHPTAVVVDARRRPARVPPPVRCSGPAGEWCRPGRRPSWRTLAERLGAPVLTSVEGRGAIPEDHPLALGANGDSARLDPVIADADVVLAVGTRFQLGSNSPDGAVDPRTPDPPRRRSRRDRPLPSRRPRHRRRRRGSASRRSSTRSPADSGRADPAFVDRRHGARRADAEADGDDGDGRRHARVMAEIIRASLDRDAIVVKDSTVAAHRVGQPHARGVRAAHVDATGVGGDRPGSAAGDRRQPGGRPAHGA